MTHYFTHSISSISTIQKGHAAGRTWEKFPCCWVEMRPISCRQKSFMHLWTEVAENSDLLILLGSSLAACPL